MAPLSFIKRSPFFFAAVRSLENDGVRLRPLRITDIPIIRKGLQDAEVSESTGHGKPRLPARLALWWWLKKRYRIFFSIEVESKCIGIIGLYDLKPCESAKVSLLLFDKTMRRRGYGSRTCTAIAAHLRQTSLVKRLIAEVEGNNQPSLCFWKKLGFHEIHAECGVSILVKDLHGSDA